MSPDWSRDEFCTGAAFDVEKLVGPLPASATKFKQWWATNQLVADTFKQWRGLNAGRQVEHVDLSGRLVRFSAASWRRGS